MQSKPKAVSTVFSVEAQEESPMLKITATATTRTTAAKSSANVVFTELFIIPHIPECLLPFTIFKYKIAKLCVNIL